MTWFLIFVTGKGNIVLFQRTREKRKKKNRSRTSSARRSLHRAKKIVILSNNIQYGLDDILADEAERLLLIFLLSSSTWWIFMVTFKPREGIMVNDGISFTVISSSPSRGLAMNTYSFSKSICIVFSIVVFDGIIIRSFVSSPHCQLSSTYLWLWLTITTVTSVLVTSRIKMSFYFHGTKSASTTSIFLF